MLLLKIVIFYDHVNGDILTRTINIQEHLFWEYIFKPFNLIHSLLLVLQAQQGRAG